MKKDYEVNATVCDNTSSTPEDYSNAYSVIKSTRKRLNGAMKDLRNSLPTEINFCNTLEIFKALNNITGTLGTITSDLTRDINRQLTGSDKSTSLDIPAGSQRYYAASVVLKEYQLLKYECERDILIVKRIVAETSKKIIVALIDGEGSNEVTPIQVPMTILSTFATIASKAIDALSKLLSFLDKMSVLNVKSSGCCFFITPKSMKKTDIKIKNTNESLTNSIPEWMDKLLSEAEQKIKENVADKRNSEIDRMKTNGANSAASGDLNVGDMVDLPKFDPNVVRTARNALLQTLLDAEGLPRYEDLKITNVRFLTYLVTGFEPAAKKNFGIPGYP